MKCTAERTRRPHDESPRIRPPRRAPPPPHRQAATPTQPEASRSDGSGMKLLMTIVSDGDADGLIRAMVERGYPATKIGSTGGFLRRGNTTLLSGVEGDAVEAVIGLVRQLCPVRTELLTLSALPVAGEPLFLNGPIEVRAGGAVVFVLDIARFERV